MLSITRARAPWVSIKNSINTVHFNNCRYTSISSIRVPLSKKKNVNICIYNDAKNTNMFGEQEFKRMLRNAKINEFDLGTSELIRPECLRRAQVNKIKSKGNTQRASGFARERSLRER